MDVGDTHDLNSMAKAVENSYCVLMCVTHKYRQSLYSQAEAQLAYKLRKPIIPLIMETHLTNVRGWLGNIIDASKISYIDFAKLKYDESLRRIKMKIETFNLKTDRALIHKPISTINDKIVEKPKTTTKSNGKNNAVKWNENDVRYWLANNNIDTEIRETLSQCEGDDLKQLYDMKRTAPEFYFQSLNESGKVKLKSVLLFSRLLEQLFQ